MTENGRVTFRSDLDGICRSNLWLRSADRVLLKVGEFRVATFDELFEQTMALNWADWIPEDGRFPVKGKSVRSTLHSVPDCQAIVKKAIAESMKKRYRRSWFDETGPLYEVAAWTRARSEAKDLERSDERLEVLGSDIDRDVLRIAEANAALAGVSDRVRFRAEGIERLTAPGEYGCLVCNPPYGERLGELREVEALYRTMGRVFASMPTWSFFVLSPHPRFERILGMLATRKRKLYNGRIECHYYQFLGPRPPRADA